MSVADLISKGFGGYAGWGEAEAAADFAATGGAGKLTGGAGGTAGGGNEYADIENVPSVEKYVKGQFATEDVALKDLIMAMKARQQPLDIYTQLETEAGLPELRKASTSLSKEIASLEDLLLQIEPDITAKTRESLVTEAQRRGMVTEEKRPWVEKLGTLGTALGRVGERMGIAERGVATKAELTMKGQEQELEPLKLYYSTMVDRNARLTTGFTADRQTQLDILFDKLQRTRYLDDREWDLANEIASEERQYIKTLGTSAAEAGITLKGTETADEILALIGTTAAEAIKWERGYKERTLAKQGGGTQTEREEAAALVAVRRDAQAGTTYTDLLRRYGNKLQTWQIRDEYNNALYYGTKAGETATQEQQVLAEKPPATDEEVNNNVKALKAAGASEADIKSYILSQGKNPSDYGYGGGSWWNPFD